MQPKSQTFIQLFHDATLTEKGPRTPPPHFTNRADLEIDLKKQPILVCRPSYFTVNYTINPWMFDQIGKCNTELAQAQWFDFIQILRNYAEVFPYSVDPSPSHPDLVFTANAGIILSGLKSRNPTVLLASFRHQQRQGESDLYGRAFVNLGFKVIEPPPGIFIEGAGDSLQDAYGVRWLAVGPRTNMDALEYFKQQTHDQVELLSLITEQFYHLDTAFCPLSNGYALAYLPAFSMLSQNRLKDAFGSKLIELTYEEACHFNANAIESGGAIFMNNPSDRLTQILKAIGYVVEALDLSEFLKAGGSSKCLCLNLAKG